MVRTPRISPFWPQILSLTLELSRKTSKNYVFEQIFKHSLNFEPLFPLISGLNSKFDYATLCVLNWSLVIQNFVFKSHLYQKLSRKNLWRVGSPPPPPPDQEGLILCFSNNYGRWSIISNLNSSIIHDWGKLSIHRHSNGVRSTVCSNCILTSYGWLFSTTMILCILYGFLANYVTNFKHAKCNVCFQ